MRNCKPVFTRWKSAFEGPAGLCPLKRSGKQWTHLSPFRRNHFLFHPSKRFVSAESKWAKKTTQKLVWKWNLSSLKMTAWSPYPGQVQVILKMQVECIKFSSCVEGLFPVTVASSKLAPTMYRVSRLRIQLQSTPSTHPCQESDRLLKCGRNVILKAQSPAGLHAPQRAGCRGGQRILTRSQPFLRDCYWAPSEECCVDFRVERPTNVHRLFFFFFK